MEDWKKKLSVLITEGLYEQVTDDKGERVFGYVNCSDKVLKELDALITQEIEKARRKGVNDVYKRFCDWEMPRNLSKEQKEVFDDLLGELYRLENKII